MYDPLKIVFVSMERKVNISSAFMCNFLDTDWYASLATLICLRVNYCEVSGVTEIDLRILMCKQVQITRACIHNVDIILELEQLLCLVALHWTRLFDCFLLSSFLLSSFLLRLLRFFLGWFLAKIIYDAEDELNAAHSDVRAVV